MKFIIRNKIDIIIRYLLGSLLLFTSLWFALNSENKESFKKFHQPDYVRLLLGITEAIAAALFIIRKTCLIGATGLLILFIYAAYLHINAGLKAYGLIPWTLGILFVLWCGTQRSQVITKKR